MGRGDEKAADQTAVNVMRDFLNEFDINDNVVIGVGDRAKAPMYYIGNCRKGWLEYRYCS